MCVIHIGRWTRKEILIGGSTLRKDFVYDFLEYSQVWKIHAHFCPEKCHGAIRWINSFNSCQRRCIGVYSGLMAPLHTNKQTLSFLFSCVFSWKIFVSPTFFELLISRLLSYSTSKKYYSTLTIYHLYRHYTFCLTLSSFKLK